MKKDLREKPLFALVLVLSLIVCGCAIFAPSGPTEVSDSQLNTLQVNYTPPEVGGELCHINLIGAGYIHIKRGRSPRVHKAFSQAVTDANWQDCREEKLGVAPDVIRAWLQKFVDAGLTTERKRASRRIKESDFGKKCGIANFAASIDGETYMFVTDNPELLNPIMELLEIVKSGGEYK